MTKRMGPRANGAPNTTDQADKPQDSASAGYVTSSRQVDWYRVWLFVRPLLRSCPPIPGTPAWCALSDRDPAKLAAVLLAGALWSLNESIRQDAAAQASRDVSAAYDWAAIAARIHQRERFYRDKPYLRRTSA